MARCDLQDEESGCYSKCHASIGDGECFWKDCPQEANNRANYKGHCPLDLICAVHGPTPKAGEKR